MRVNTVEDDLNESSDSFFEVLFAYWNGEEESLEDYQTEDESLGDDRVDESLGDDRVDESLGDMLSSISPSSSEPYSMLETIEKCSEALHSHLSKDLTQKCNSSKLQMKLDNCLEELKTEAIELVGQEKREVFTSFY